MVKYLCNCGDIFATRQSLVDHLNEVNPLKNPEDIRHVKNLRKQQRPQFQCPICLKGGNSIEPHVSHLRSVGHAKNSMKFITGIVNRTVVDGAAAAPMPTTSTVSSRPFIPFCHICDFELFDDLSSYDAHVTTDAHLTNLVKKYPDIGNMKCDICGCDRISGNRTYITHMRSPSHKVEMNRPPWQDVAWNQKKMQEEAACTSTSTSTQYFSVESISTPSVPSSIISNADDEMMPDDPFVAVRSPSEMTLCATELSSGDMSDSERSWEEVGGEEDDEVESSEDEPDSEATDDSEEGRVDWSDYKEPYMSGKGLMIIYNNEFRGNSKRCREGSAKDAARLKKLFGKFGFDIEEHIDLNLSQMVENLNDTRERLRRNPDKYKMLLLFVLSHGREGNLETADSEYLPFHELLSTFSNINCPAMRGKPKVIFICTCRGDVYGDVVALRRKVQKRKFEGEVSSDGPVNPKPIFEAMPCQSDFAMCFASIHEKGAFRYQKHL